MLSYLALHCAAGEGIEFLDPPASTSQGLGLQAWTTIPHYRYFS